MYLVIERSRSRKCDGGGEGFFSSFFFFFLARDIDCRMYISRSIKGVGPVIVTTMLFSSFLFECGSVVQNVPFEFHIVCFICNLERRNLQIWEGDDKLGVQTQFLPVPPI